MADRQTSKIWRNGTRASALLAGALLCACATPPQTNLPHGHLSEPQAAPAGLPQPVTTPTYLPKPSRQAKLDTYSVVVSNVPVRDMLFALARDAKVNVDVHPLIRGTVTLNALHQTLPQILERIQRQVDMRYALENGVLTVLPDRPYLKTYTIDYVNIARSAQGKVSISTSISSGGTGTGGGGSNASSTEVSNSADNKFWERLEKNLRDILASTRRVQAEDKAEREEQEDKDDQARVAEANEQRAREQQKAQESRLQAAQAVAQAGAGAPALMAMVMQTPPATAGRSASASSTEGNDVFVHPESGVVTVNATEREHAKIREYMDKVATGARRQVLIEATIVEVQLSDQYQAGIDWSILKQQDNRLNFEQRGGSSFPALSSSSPLAVLSYSKLASGLLQGADLKITLKMLEEFGKTKVLSSPKAMVINNQTALLKAVVEEVYFDIKATVTPASANSAALVSYTSTPKSTPIGVLMTVTPQVAADGMVTLNVRPTVSALVGQRRDPNPDLTSIANLVPVVAVREVESTLKLASGQTAILGGLIKDELVTNRQGVPGLSRLPFGIGDLFASRDDKLVKSELVIFLRPTVIENPSLNGDLADFKQYLPGDDFFTKASDEISVFGAGASNTRENK